jgi:hypothetical protein
MILLVTLTSACDGSGSSPDAGSTPVCDAGCTITIADYCNAQPCPIATECGVKVYSGCGYTHLFNASEQDIFDPDGGLVAIYSSGAGPTCCVAGPPDFEIPGLQGCTLATPSCDAGAD